MSETMIEAPPGWDEFLSTSKLAAERGEVVPMATVLDIADASVARMIARHDADITPAA